MIGDMAERHIIDCTGIVERQHTQSNIAFVIAFSEGRCSSQHDFIPPLSLVPALPSRRHADRHHCKGNAAAEKHTSPVELFLSSLFWPYCWVVCRRLPSHAVSLSLLCWEEHHHYSPTGTGTRPRKRILRITRRTGCLEAREHCSMRKLGTLTFSLLDL